MPQGSELRKLLMERFRTESRLRRLSRDIDFQQNVLPYAGRFRPPVDLPGQFEAVDRMDQVEDSDDRPGLPTLQLADETWPSEKPGLKKFKSEFSQALRDSQYWKEFYY